MSIPREKAVFCEALITLNRSQRHRLIDELVAGTCTGRVRGDFPERNARGVNGTPTFLINGVRYDGALSVTSLLAALTELNTL